MILLIIIFVFANAKISFIKDINGADIKCCLDTFLSFDAFDCNDILSSICSSPIKNKYSLLGSLCTGIDSTQVNQVNCIKKKIEEYTGA